jgi:DNA-directed RNA polymerase specialized sigma24 family protein
VFDPRKLSYEELESRYGYMLDRFSRYRIGGHVDSEDIKQELRIALVMAQQNYQADKPGAASFGWYLWQSMQNTVYKLDLKCNRRPSKVGVSQRVSLEQTGIDIEGPELEELEVVELLTGLSREAQTLARGVLRGETSELSWRRLGLTRQQIKRARAELRPLLGAGDLP